MLNINRYVSDKRETFFFFFYFICFSQLFSNTYTEKRTEREKESAQSNKFDQGFLPSSKGPCLSFLVQYVY